MDTPGRIKEMSSERDETDGEYDIDLEESRFHHNAGLEYQRTRRIQDAKTSDKLKKALSDLKAEVEDVRTGNPGVPVKDVANLPHYTAFKIQPIEFFLANKEHLDFLQCNAIKYICRFRMKNGIEDLEKAKNYINLLIQQELKKGI